MSTVSLVSIGDDTLQAIVDEAGTVHVVVARVCEALGIDVDSQRKRIQQSPWGMRKSSLRPIADSMGRERATLCIELDALPMWLATADASKASPAAHAKLVRFQIEARDVLAAHFGIGGRVNLQSPRPSGGASGSGATARTAMNAVPAGAALEQLAAIEHMGSMLSGLLQVARTNAQAIAAVEARVEGTEAALAEATARADDAVAIAARVRNEGAHFREHRRRLDTAVGHITRQVRRFCGQKGVDYREVYSKIRAELGLRRSQDGGPALGKAKLRADQVLRMARLCHNMSINECSVAVIESILNGDDDATRAGAIDAETQAIQ